MESQYSAGVVGLGNDGNDSLGADLMSMRWFLV